MQCVHSNGLSALNGAGCRSRLRQLDLGNMVERSEGRAPARGHFAADAAGCSRLMGEDDTGTLARLAGVAHAMCGVWDELVDLVRMCDASELGVVLDVTALPLSPLGSRNNAEDPDLVSRLAGVGEVKTIS